LLCTGCEEHNGDHEEEIKERDKMLSYIGIECGFHIVKVTLLKEIQ
jgi:hypothetical protein